MKITFDVVNQRISRTDDNKIVADSKNYLYAQFFFKTDDWDDITKTAVFEKGGKPYFVILDEDDTCKVPWEVIKPGKVFVSVFGGDLITTHTVELHISVSGYKEGETPTEPTPDVYSQILDKLKNLQAGEISDEQISKAINEYLAENPISGGVSDDSLKKNIVLMGDSITYEAKWVDYIQKKVSFNTLTNLAVNFATMKNKENTSYNLNVEASNNDDNVAWNQFNKLVHLTDDEQIPLPDVIITMLGTNDVLRSQNVGTFEDSWLEEKIINKEPTYNTSTAWGFRYLIELLKHKYPQATIIVCTPIQNGGNYANGLLKTVSEIYKETGGKLGIEVVDQYNECGIYGKDESLYGIYTRDNTHPNDVGGKKQGKYLLSKLIPIIKYADGSDSVAINIPAESITLDNATLELSSNTQVTLKETIVPSNHTEIITWTSSNSDIATVKNGVVNAVSDGNCVITVNVGKLSAICNVTVNIGNQGEEGGSDTSDETELPNQAIFYASKFYDGYSDAIIPEGYPYMVQTNYNSDENKKHIIASQYPIKSIDGVARITLHSGTYVKGICVNGQWTMTEETWDKDYSGLISEQVVYCNHNIVLFNDDSIVLKARNYVQSDYEAL